MDSWLTWVFLFTLVATVHARGAEPPPVSPALRVAWPSDMLDDPRGRYPIDLLRLALERAPGGLRIQPARFDMSQSRALLLLERNLEIDLVWAFSSRERERRLLPVRIPIDRGLLGWRLLIRPASDAGSIADDMALRNLRLLQGRDWPDVAVLRANGLVVVEGSSFEGLFEMLRRGRADALPRAVSEVFAELELPLARGLSLESDWVLHYPAPVYFFVNRERPELAQALELGLRAAIKDGSAIDLFRRSFGSAIEQADLKRRRRLELNNGDLHPDTPLADQALWFDPEQGY